MIIQPTSSGVDEVRQIRREIAEQFGHDLDKLGEELRRVELEYAGRIGVFAHVTTEAATRVLASWGDLSGPACAGHVEEIRELRQRLAKK